MKKAIFTLAVLVMAFGNLGLAQSRINLRSLDKATMLKHYGVRERNEMVPQTANWQDTYGDKYRVTYEYDENEYYLNTEIYEVLWDGVWQEYEMISYQYDFSGFVLEELVQDFDGEEWIDMARTTYSYQNGMVDEVIVQYWEDGAWVNVEKAVYNFNGYTSTILYWDWNGTTWSSHELYTFTYDTQSVELLIQYMQGGAWQNDEKQIMTLDYDEHISSILVQDWQNNAWVNDQRITYDYANGVFDSKIEETWTGSVWEAITKYSYTYDDGNAITGSCEVKEGGEFVTGDGEIEMAFGYSSDSKSYWGYEVSMTYIDLTGVNESASTFGFEVYPVPAVNEIQIQVEGFEKAEIYSLTGQRLMESTSSTVDVRSLSAGVYMLKVVRHDGNSATQRMVVQ